MKKMLIVLMMFGLIFVLGSCGSGANYEEVEDYSTEEEVEDNDIEEEVEEQVDISKEADLISRGTWDIKDYNGYTVQGEIKTTDFIRATDWETVENTYNNLESSSGSLYSFDALSPDNTSQETSAVLIGTIRLTNTTDGWDFSENAPHECRLGFAAPDWSLDSWASLCVEFESGVEKHKFGGHEYYLNTNAIMKSNSWEVPFIIVLPNVFTPNEPNGCESVFNTVFRASDGMNSCEFTVPSLVE